MRETIRFGCASDPGCVRNHNEDAYLAIPEMGLWLVADGMGGHAAGEVASAIVVENVEEQIRGGASLVSALRHAHRAVLSEARQGRGKPGMGATAVALKLEGLRYEVAWVGDSRAYHWGNCILQQLTRDHRVVQDLLDKGTIDEEQARVHPYRNLISQSLGSSRDQDVHIDLVFGELFPGESILLCSDGLTGELSEEEIAEILSQFADEQVVADLLVARALDKGGFDNVTAVLVAKPDDTEVTDTAGSPAP